MNFVLASLPKNRHSRILMKAHHQISKNEQNQFEAHHRGCLIGEFDTEQEAQAELDREDEDEEELAREFDDADALKQIAEGK